MVLWYKNYFPTEQLLESLSETCFGLAHVIIHVHKGLLLNICGCCAFESMLEEECFFPFLAAILKPIVHHNMHAHHDLTDKLLSQIKQWLTVKPYCVNSVNFSFCKWEIIYVSAYACLPHFIGYLVFEPIRNAITIGSMNQNVIFIFHHKVVMSQNFLRSFRALHYYILSFVYVNAFVKYRHFYDKILNSWWANMVKFRIVEKN